MTLMHYLCKVVEFLSFSFFFSWYIIWLVDARSYKLLSNVVIEVTNIWSCNVLYNTFNDISVSFWWCLFLLVRMLFFFGYGIQVLASRFRHILNFYEDLTSLEAASKVIPLKCVCCWSYRIQFYFSFIVWLKMIFCRYNWRH